MQAQSSVYEFSSVCGKKSSATAGSHFTYFGVCDSIWCKFGPVLNPHCPQEARQQLCLVGRGQSVATTMAVYVACPRQVYNDQR